MISAQRASSAQSGVLALGLALLMIVFVAMFAALVYVGPHPPPPGTDQDAILQWAEEAIEGFATTRGRLPCPSRTPGGAEDCDAAFAKGWLPVASIEPVAPIAPVAPGSHDRSAASVIYVVYRGAGGGDPDLAEAGDAYRPTQDPGYPSIGGRNADLCGKLRATTPPPDGRASVVDPADAAGVTRIAYGIAVAFQGQSVADSALNAGPAPRLESPWRPAEATYRDRVRVQDFDAFAQVMSCGITLASLDTLAVATTWTEDSTAKRKDSIEGSFEIVKIESVIIASEIVDLISSTIDTVASIVTAAQAQALVVVATAGLPFTLPVLVLAELGVATSISAHAMAIVDTIVTALGLTTESLYSLSYLDLALRAEASRVWHDALPLLAAADAKGSAP